MTQQQQQLDAALLGMGGCGSLGPSGALSGAASQLSGVALGTASVHVVACLPGAAVLPQLPAASPVSAPCAAACTLPAVALAGASVHDSCVSVPGVSVARVS